MADWALIRRVIPSIEEMEIPGSEKRKTLLDNTRVLFQPEIWKQ